MKNNKGFAISLMLYAMILLIVTIFYIVLAIVKNRFTYSEKMVNNVIVFLDQHDESMKHGDRTGPLVVFNPPATAFSSNGLVTIDIFDDNDGKGLDTSSIIIKVNKDICYDKSSNNGTVIVNKLDSKHSQFIVTLPNNLLIGTSYNTLSVSVKDGEGNYSQTLPRKIENNLTYSYQTYGFTLTGPSCTVSPPYRRIKEKVNAGDSRINVTEEKDGVTNYYYLHYDNISSTTVPSGEDIFYSIDCTGVNGINAYLNPTDFKDNNTLTVSNIVVIKGINKAKAIIQIGTHLPTDSPGCASKTLELKDNINITDSVGNKSNKIDFASVTVCLTNG